MAESKQKTIYLAPLTDEELLEFKHRLVDLGLSFSEWIRLGIQEEIKRD